MDYPDFPAGKSPRRELQGPRPTPLKVRKDSHKIRKPPVVPHPTTTSQPPAPPRQPVIIYTVSPKVIHTHPSEFMTLVQRLTGSSSSSSSTCTSMTDNGGALSPAARFATMEKITNKSPENKKPQSGDHMSLFEGMELSSELERTGFPGILSPGPGSLQPIPSSFFSPPSDPNPLNFFHDLSPVLQGSYKNYIDGSFMMPSPSSSFFSPHITSPTPSLDIFNNFFNL